MCLFTVAPVLAGCPVAPLVLECGLDNTTAISGWLALVTATDACETTATVTNNYVAGNLLSICNADATGLIVMFASEDGCENESTCSGEIRLEDTTSPVIIGCPTTDLIVECGQRTPEEQETFIGMWIGNSLASIGSMSTGNCGIDISMGSLVSDKRNSSKSAFSFSLNFKGCMLGSRFPIFFVPPEL